MKKKLNHFTMALTFREAQGYVDLGNNEVIKTENLVKLLEDEGYKVNRTHKHGIIKIEKEFKDG